MIKNNISSQLCFRFTKIFDIFYTCIISLIFAMITAFLSDKLFGKFDIKKWDEYKKNNSKLNFNIKLVTKTVLVASYTGIILYILRNIIELIPSPLNGICGFEHKRLGEIKSFPAIIFVLFFYYQIKFYSYLKDNFIFFNSD